ncbi:MAG: uncharacterized protein K0R24_742 [Gammaproteobacteria bacterium]|jgi:glycine oxidase|nr:uncharacterized protein [Gammaproteobacteria bacterium]
MKAGIAGGGILGQLLAFALINIGWDVTLFDFRKKQTCSETAAGLLSPVAELNKNDLVIFKLGLEAIEEHWPKVLAHLDEKIYFQRKGSLLVSYKKDDADLTYYIQLVSRKLGNNSEHYQFLSQEEIKKLEPQVTPFQQGYYFPTEAQIDNQALLKNLQENLIARGVHWVGNTYVEKIGPGKICVKNNDHSFDLVFDCRGLGAKNEFENLRSVRGELIWLHAPQVTITRPIRFLHPRYSLYIAPRPDYHYILGTSEIESDDLSPISVRTTLELLTAAYSIHPNFSEARIVNTATHCRPTLADNLPKIKYSEGLIAINGLYRHGFLIGPSLVYDVLRWIEQGISAVHYIPLWEKHENRGEI